MSSDNDLLKAPAKTLAKELSKDKLPAGKTAETPENSTEELSKPQIEELSDAEKQTAMADYYFEIGF